MIKITKQKGKKNGGVLDNVYSEKMRQEYLNTLDTEWISIPFNLNLYKIEIRGVHIAYAICLISIVLNLIVGQSIISLTDNNLILLLGVLTILSMGVMIFSSLLLEAINKLFKLSEYINLF